MELVFIRHTSVAVPKGTCYGQSDVPLSDTFETEAENVKKKLKNQVFDAVYCSPLSRCHRLAEYCSNKPIMKDRRLLEINFGDWEMQKFDEITDPRLHEWYADYINVKATGGESFLDQYKRVADFIEDISKCNYKRVAIFTHGGVLMQVMLMHGLATPDNIIERQPQYGEILEIEI